MNIHLNLLHDRLAQLRYDEVTKGCSAIIDARAVDTLRSIEVVLGDANPLTVENGLKRIGQRIVSDAVIIRSECKLDCDQPIIDVWFDLRGERTVMTIWIETNGRLYGEY